MAHRIRLRSSQVSELFPASSGTDNGNARIVASLPFPGHGTGHGNPHCRASTDLGARPLRSAPDSGRMRRDRDKPLFGECGTGPNPDERHPALTRAPNLLDCHGGIPGRLAAQLTCDPVKTRVRRFASPGPATDPPEIPVQYPRGSVPGFFPGSANGDHLTHAKLRSPVWRLRSFSQQC